MSLAEVSKGRDGPLYVFVCLRVEHELRTEPRYGRSDEYSQEGPSPFCVAIPISQRLMSDATRDSIRNATRWHK